MLSLRALFVASSVAGVATFAASVLPTEVGAQAPIKIGVVTPHSPPGSIAQGSEARAGLEVAADMINEQGGLLGRKVKLLFEDGRGVPEDGRAATERLITKDQVALLTGGVHSSVCMAKSDVTKKHNVVFMNVNCWSDAIREKGYDVWWNTSVNNSRIAVGGAQMIKGLGVKRVIAFAENTDFGIGLAEKLKAQLETLAPDVDYRFEVADRESKDFTPQISGVKGNPPDVVVTIMDPPAGYIMINQLYEQGVAPSAKTHLLDLDALAELPDFWNNVSQAGKHMMGLVLSHPNMKLTTLGQTVRDRHRQKSGREASRVVYQGFDALWALADAVKRGGSLETGKVVGALRGTKLVGTRGTITFNLDKGSFFQQWTEVPYGVVQFTAVKQPLAEAPIVYPPHQATGSVVTPR